MTEAYTGLTDLMKKQIEEQIFREHPLLKQLRINKEKERAMYDDEEIARKAVGKRKEARAKLVAEKVGEYFEDSEWGNGDLACWSVVFTATPDRTYHYVAVKGGSWWYITGDSSRYSVDDIVEKIVTLSLKGTVVGDWGGDDD
jgi:hypothetical protein